jgi:ribosomal protein S27AE
MASAAYWIGSACDEVVASPSADTGSIGVYTVHVDASGYNEKLGLKYTLIKAGDHKAEGNPWEPLSEDAESFIQGQIDEMGTTFVAAVAKHRGKKASEINANFGQGRCFTAKQALAAGMVDRIATLEDVLGKLGAKDVGMSGRPRRAFGQAAAVMNDRGIVETPITLTARAEDTPDPETTPDHDMCPECGGALDDDGHCGTCGYTKSQTDRRRQRTTRKTAAVQLPRAPTGRPRGAHISPTTGPSRPVRKP